jgi:putative salt-induced outer membrane protein
MRRRVHVILFILAFTLALSTPQRALAQVLPAAAPPPPPPGWAGNISAGLAITSGNADTSNFNVAVKASFDPANPHMATMEALYLRGSSEGRTTVSRTSLNLRDDYALDGSASVFGQFRYLRDTFKGIDYLVAPTVGLGYKVVNRERLRFDVDAGAGVAWERDSALGTTTTDGAITAGENVTYHVTATTVVTHGATALWKTADFSDALYTAGAGLAAALTARTQLKLEVLELFKTQPPIGKQSQDVSFITSVVYSF